jgi:hypothetical protein
MLPRLHSLAHVEAELPGALAWAERQGVQLLWLPEELAVHAILRQPETDLLFFLAGEFDDYRELPPIWRLCSADWKSAGSKEHFPRPLNSFPLGSCMFIVGEVGPVVCAPFNRLAYAEYKGPHGDWGGPTQWLSAAPGHIHATTLGEMITAVHLHLQYTRGRMSDG